MIAEERAELLKNRQYLLCVHPLVFVDSFMMTL